MTDSKRQEAETVTGGPPDLVGETLDGRYYVEQKLSSGGIGDLYLANDKPALMSRRVVVKVLQEKALKDEWLVTKFRQEVEALTRIDDPGVVGLLDAGTLPNGHPYLVMQFVEGENLRSVMRPDRGMDLDDVAEIWQQVTRTLSAAHDCEVIHRDLKPENIMVRQRPDGSWQVKVIDFGIARIRNSLVAPSTVTGKVAGTVSYMSPEQIEGRKAFAVSDIYSLGVIAYELVTGRRPFNPETTFQLSELQKAVPVSPRALRPALSRAAETAILKALAYRAADRYQRAREFGDDLARALREDDEATRPQAKHDEAAGRAPDDRAGLNQSDIPTIVNEPTPAPNAEGAKKESAPPVIVPGSPDLAVGSEALPGENLRRRWFRLVGVLGALLLLAVAGVVAWNVYFGLLAPERSLTYWLTVQRMYDGKPLGESFNATGRDYFHTGDRFFLNVAVGEAGALYLVSEGRDERGASEWNILFPTRDNNQGLSALAARQNIKTGWYRFTGSTGVEQVWLIWSTQPIAELDAIFRDAMADGVVHDPGRLTQLQEFLKQHQASPTELIQDENNERAFLKGRGQVLVRRLDFSHKAN